MIAFDVHPMCREAAIHYYDFLKNDKWAGIPAHIVEHIRRCRRCQERVKQLDVVLKEAQEGPKSPNQVDAALTVVRLHMAYIGKPVTCETAKPFLPLMLDAAMQVRVPTPITVHIDHCGCCAADLETIRGLDLGGGQLRRLSGLLAERRDDDGIECAQVQDAIVSAAKIAFDEIDAETLRHLSLCPYCQGLVAEARQVFLKDASNKRDSAGPSCSAVPDRDIFDFVAPYGLDGGHDLCGETREALILHVRRCPDCIGRMQQLHELVYDICQRADSGVVTQYDLDASARGRADDKRAYLYAGFPIKVSVTSTEQDVPAGRRSEPVISLSAAREKNWRRRAKVIGAAGAVAAAIAVALLLSFSGHTAKAVGIAQIYEAVEAARNIHITHYVTGKSEPLQEMWISRTRNAYLTKTGDLLVLWDLDEATKTQRVVGGGTSESSGMTENNIEAVREKLAAGLGLVPFDKMDGIPFGATFEPAVTAEAISGEEVHDLVWVARAPLGLEVSRRWRVFADPVTHLPLRTELYERFPEDTDYVLRVVMEVTALSDGQMGQVLRGFGF